MENDLFLTLGILMMLLALPSLLSAWVESRAPRLGALLLLGGIGLIALAFWRHPGGYQLNEMPRIMLATFGRLLH